MKKTQRFPVGTKFIPTGKDYVSTVKDFHVVTNLAGEEVRSYYVATHLFCGQTVTDPETCDTTIARGIILPLSN